MMNVLQQSGREYTTEHRYTSGCMNNYCKTHQHTKATLMVVDTLQMRHKKTLKHKN